MFFVHSSVCDMGLWQPAGLVGFISGVFCYSGRNKFCNWLLGDAQGSCRGTRDAAPWAEHHEEPRALSWRNPSEEAELATDGRWI